MKSYLRKSAVFVCILLSVGCSGRQPPIYRLIQLMQEGKHDEAIALGEKLTAENPDNTQAYRFLLKSASAKSQEEFEEEYKKKYGELIQADPNIAGYHFALGYVHAHLQELDAALAEFQKAIELNPDIEYAHYMIGWIYFNWQNPKKDAVKALAEWKKEEQLNPRSLGALQVYADRADYYLRIGKSDGAIRDYEKVAMYGFARDDIRDARGLITRIRAIKDELARLENEARNNPDDANIRVDLGKMQYKNSMIEKAIETWAKGVELDPENAELRNYLGKGLHEVGRHAEAAAQLKKAVELDPTLTMSYYNLAMTEDVLGKTDDAIEHYNRYIELNPMSPRLEPVKQRIAELEGKADSREES